MISVPMREYYGESDGYVSLPFKVCSNSHLLLAKKLLNATKSWLVLRYFMLGSEVQR